MDRDVLVQKTKFGGASAVVGAVVWWFVLAHGFGWISPSTAQQQTSDATQVAVDNALSPLCADKFMLNEAAVARFQKATGYDQNTVVQNAIPKLGTTAMDYQLSDACGNVIEARLKSAAKLALKKN